MPIRPDEAVKLVKSYKSIIVINEKDDSEIFSGCIAHLDEFKLRQIIINPLTTKMRSPALFLKHESLVLLGWSKSIWSEVLGN